MIMCLTEGVRRQKPWFEWCHEPVVELGSEACVFDAWWRVCCSRQCDPVGQNLDHVQSASVADFPPFRPGYSMGEAPVFSAEITKKRDRAAGIDIGASVHRSIGCVSIRC